MIICGLEVVLLSYVGMSLFTFVRAVTVWIFMECSHFEVDGISY